MDEGSVIQIRQKIVFEGGDADEHRLEAYQAAQSLEGLIWALTVTMNYGVTGKLRQRGDLSQSVKIFISPPKRGSVINELNILVQQNPFISLIVGGWAVNTVTPFLNGLVARTFSSAMGATVEVPARAKKFLKKLNGTKVDDLIVRIEPPLTRAHSVIGRSADSISLNIPRRNLATFTPQTKQFLEARLRHGFHIVDTNVTSFNVLTGNGRLYDEDEERTVPFSLQKGPLDGTADVLISSMRQYGLGRFGTIRITAQRVETADGRLKQYLISAAEQIPQVEWIDGVDPMYIQRI